LATEESNMIRLERFHYPLLALFILMGNQTLVADEAKIKEGEQLYAQNCVFCHQADAIGKPGFAPSLSNPEFLSVASDRFLLSTIRDGRLGTGMPPFAHLGRDKGRAIVAYLRSFSELPNRSAEVDAQPDAHGDPRLGQLWFNYICSTCHGPNGDGYAAGGTGTAIGKSGTLNKVSDGFLRTTIKQGRSNTRMLGFSGPDGLANLSDQEIDDIIVYLRTLVK
jgi:cytochrome c oxidase cbb3-type subunit 3